MLVKCAILECLDWKHCIYSPGSERDFLGDIYIPQEVELLPEGYKYCPEIRSSMGYIPLAVPLILELPELQNVLINLNFASVLRAKFEFASFPANAQCSN